MRASELLASPGTDGLAGPVGYSGWWVVLGVALVVLVIAWYGWVLLSTRRDRGDRRAGVPARDLLAVRARYLAQVDAVAMALEQAELDTRAAHQRLSAVVRAYAGELGHPVSSATLAELARTGPQPVAETISAYYPGEFAPTPQGDPHAAVLAARRLVGSWP